MLEGQRGISKAAAVLLVVATSAVLYNYPTGMVGGSSHQLVTTTSFLKDASATLVASGVAMTVQAMQQFLRPRGWALVAVYLGNDSAPALTSKWASQAGQEVTVLDVMAIAKPGEKQAGYFIDLAANDAVHISNTVVLEKHGWQGLCVEANPQYNAGLMTRKCQNVRAAVGRDDNEVVTFNLKNYDSGIVGQQFDNKQQQATAETMTYHTVSLRSILTDLGVPRTIDYFSFDIEGAEDWVMETFPWDTHTFLLMTVERPKPVLRGILSEHNYVHLCDHGSWGDEFWVHRSLPNFEAVAAKYGAEANQRSEYGKTFKECRPDRPMSQYWPLEGTQQDTA